MKQSEFNAYKTEFRAVIRKVLAESEQGRLDEAGFPAYSHKNPLINWLFWQRLRKAIDYIEAGAPYENVLDFGCGSGVMLPFLCQIGTRVTAMDIDLLPFERVSRQRAFPANLQVHDAREVTLSDLPKASFDLIVATDVLEHVEDIEGTLNDMKSLLTARWTNRHLRPNRKCFIQTWAGAGRARILRRLPRARDSRGARIAGRADAYYPDCHAVPAYAVVRGLRRKNLTCDHQATRARRHKI
jgi:2-polyprenyl-3-methyl-5-hydroxy-6-metoxy-1,4-benzoquinol methylase